MKRPLSALALLAGFAPALGAPALADDKLSLATGFDYSTGHYGNADPTEILYIPVTGKYESGDLTLKLTVPYIRITGPGGVIQGIGRIAAPGGSAGAPGRPGGPPGPPGGGTGGTSATATGSTSTASGLGDVVASAGYTVYSGDGLWLDAIGKVKFGTADAGKGLGTGKNDYFAQLDGYYTLVKDTTLLATAGYKVIGSPPGIALHNAPYGMLGVDRKLGETTNAGVMYDQLNSIAATIPAQKSITVYASQKLSPAFKVQANLMKGFTTASPELGGGVMVIGYF